MIEQNQLPQALDAGFDPNQIKREWIEQVIRSRIHPAIPSVVIVPVPLSGANQGRVAYVLELPQSVTAHQAPDKKYYKRHNFANEPMLDHEIRDVMHRGDRPLVEPTFTRQVVQQQGGLHRYRLIIKVANVGALAVQRLKLQFTFPRALVEDPTVGYLRSEFHEGTGPGAPTVRFTAIRYDGMPLFPEESVDLGEWGFIPIVYRIDAQSATWVNQRSLRWKVYADNMRPREGIIPLATLHEW